MKILLACEYSGTIRDILLDLGHECISCDTLETESPRLIPQSTLTDQLNLLPDENGMVVPHYKGDVRDILKLGWDGMVAHPPCQYIASSGLHWNNKKPGRAQKTEEALEFVSELWNSGIPRIVLENPVGCINTRLPFMPKAVYVQPYMFGDDASKKTGLWMKGCGVLDIPEEEYWVEPRIVTVGEREYKRWGNQRDCGRDDTPNTINRAKERAKTFPGLGLAMALQVVEFNA